MAQNVDQKNGKKLTKIKPERINETRWKKKRDYLTKVNEL